MSLGSGGIGRQRGYIRERRGYGRSSRQSGLGYQNDGLKKEGRCEDNSTGERIVEEHTIRHQPPTRGTTDEISCICLVTAEQIHRLD